MLTKEFHLNLPQSKALLVNANKTITLWARGTGKTTGVLSPKSLDLVHKMPRAKGGFIGKDYEQILDRTLPEIVAGWSKLGYQENHHWRFGKPLDDWAKPLVPPIKWDHAISWYNGSVIMLLSLGVTGISNGLSLQWIMGDEAKFWDQSRLKEVLKAVRGLRDLFGHLPEYLSQWFASDKWVDDVAQIQWLLDKKKLMNEEQIEAIYCLQLEINELRRQMETMDDLELRQTADLIEQYDLLAQGMRKSAIYVSEASAKDNELILGPEWREGQRQELSSDEFAVAIDNEDPTKGRRSFYGALDKRLHYYESIADVMPNAPLIIAADYQASISPIVVAQFGKLAHERIETLNFIRTPYCLHPKGLQEACEEFLTTFQYHSTKEVYYVYDHTAIGRNPFGKTYQQLVTEVLTGAGWVVMPIYTGKAPEHGIKYEHIKNVLNNNNPMDGAPIRINIKMNEELQISLERTQAISTGGKVTEKDKKHENTSRYLDYPQQYATHIPDAFDQVIWATHVLKAVQPFVADLFLGGLGK